MYIVQIKTGKNSASLNAVWQQTIYSRSHFGSSNKKKLGVSHKLLQKEKKTKKIIKQWKQHIGVAMMEWKSF